MHERDAGWLSGCARRGPAVAAGTALLLLAGLAGCGHPPAEPETVAVEAPAARPPAPEPPDALKVLFVGNSLTFYNDLPVIVQALAKAGKQRPLVGKGVLLPSYSLEDHWNDGTVQRLLGEGRWDVVVLQQGPSGQDAARANLLEYTRRFAERIRAAKARPALYQVWPQEQDKHNFDRVCASYALAAKEVNGMLFPVGEAWRAAWRRDAGIALYDPDQSHPSPTGSYLAALVMYQRLYGQSPVGLPASLKLRGDARIEIPQRQADLLQAAAAEANQKHGLP